MSVFWYFIAVSVYAEMFAAARCLERDCDFVTIHVTRLMSRAESESFQRRITVKTETKDQLTRQFPIIEPMSGQ